MLSPERIHNVIYNAADACSAFDEIDVALRPWTKVTPETILRVLGRKAGRLFAISGSVGIDSVTVKPTSITERGIIFTQFVTEPTYSQEYTVAAEPPPYVDVHGDLHFDLEKTKH